jgi:hypothetical protein
MQSLSTYIAKISDAGHWRPGHREPLCDRPPADLELRIAPALAFDGSRRSCQERADVRTGTRRNRGAIDGGG